MFQPFVSIRFQAVITFVWYFLLSLPDLKTFSLEGFLSWELKWVIKVQRLIWKHMIGDK